MQTDAIEMPKTYREQINDLDVSESFKIDETIRRSWANFISKFHKECDKQFTIRTHRGTNEIRIWRLK